MAPLLSNLDTIHDGTRYRIKDQNKAHIYSLICKNNGTSRKGLAGITGIRPSTISRMVQELVADGLVVEKGHKTKNSLGRPEVTLCPNHDRLCVIALYNVSQELKCLLLNADGRTLKAESRFLPGDTDNAGFIEAMHGLIDTLTPGVPEGSQLVGVSLTAPGFVNARTRTWCYTSRWPNMHNLSFTELEREIGLPLVTNRALDAELQYLMLNQPAYAKGGTLLFHWGYGIGAAYAYNGTIVKTSFGSFCEIGHFALCPDVGLPCTCGAVGCLETVAALWALIPDFRKKDPNVPEEEREFQRYFTEHTLADHPSVTRAIDAIGHAVAILQTTFLPDRILMYGPLLSDPKIFDAVLRRVHEVASEFAVRDLTLEFSEATIEGDVIGGASELFRQALRTHLTAR